MLTALPAFGGRTDAETLAKVKLGKYSTDTLDDSGISPECQDFISKLLEVDPDERLSASEALEHVWLVQHRDECQPKPTATETLGHIRDFQITTGKRIQQATIKHIVNNLATQQDLDELTRVFRAINVSQTGRITIKELEEGFEAQTEEAKQDVQKIFDEVDLDGSGEIEFSEWIVASIDKKSLITDEKLKLAFQLFDKDNSGTISPHEVRRELTMNEENETEEEARLWKSIIDDVDMDGNGVIDFDEFATMIRKIVIND